MCDDSSTCLYSSGDDETVAFGEGGSIVEMMGRDGKQVPVDAEGSSLTVEDVGAGRKHPVVGETEQGDETVTLSATIDEAGLAVDATYRLGSESVLEVEGAVVDRTGSNRAVDVVFSLPFASSTGRWERNISDSERYTTDSSSADQAALPIAAVSPTDESCVAYAIPPDDPCRFAVSVSPDDESSEFTLRLKFGISSAGDGPLDGRVPFRFEVDFGVDPDWGLRSALERYYDRHDEWFETPVERYGLWEILPVDKYDDPEHFVFHEAGKYLGDAETVEEYARNDGWELDDEHGSYTLPYTIPGHREITQLDALPETNEEAMAALEQWDREPIPYENFSHVSGFRDLDELKAIIHNSGLDTADGKRKILVRNTDWGQNTVTFPLNPNPRLFDDSDAPTIAKYMLDTYAPDLLSHPSCDGIYVDSLWRWGNYFNYREEHFADATIPPTYSDERLDFGVDGKVGLLNAFSHQEYFLELRRRLHENGNLLMGNGIRVFDDLARSFNAFALDVIGVELDVNNVVDSEESAAFYRSVAYQKPVLSLTHGHATQEDIEAMWKLGVLYGIAHSTDGPDAEALHLSAPDGDDLPLVDNQDEYERRYAPVLVQLMEAGWEPVTGVRSNENAVRVERYGSGTEHYIVVYNAGEATNVTFDVDEHVMNLSEKREIEPILAESGDSAGEFGAILGEGALQIDGGELLVVKVS